MALWQFGISLKLSSCIGSSGHVSLFPEIYKITEYLL